MVKLFSHGPTGSELSIREEIRFLEGQRVININSLGFLSLDCQESTAICKINAMGNSSVISIMFGHFDSKHRCHIEKNVPKAFISPSRWQFYAESVRSNWID